MAKPQDFFIHFFKSFYLKSLEYVLNTIIDIEYNTFSSNFRTVNIKK